MKIEIMIAVLGIICIGALAAVFVLWAKMEEQKKLIGIYNAQLAAEATLTQATGDVQVDTQIPAVAPVKAYPIDIIEGDYEPEKFFDMTRDYKDCPEGGERCFLCYELRLRQTAEKALAGGFDYFGTTLTISPLKNAAKLNEIGEELEKELVVQLLEYQTCKENS